MKQFGKILRYVLGFFCLGTVLFSAGCLAVSTWVYQGNAAGSFASFVIFIGERLFVFIGFGIPLGILFLWQPIVKLYYKIKDKLTP